MLEPPGLVVVAVKAGPELDGSSTRRPAVLEVNDEVGSGDLNPDGIARASEIRIVLREARLALHPPLWAVISGVGDLPVEGIVRADDTEAITPGLASSGVLDGEVLASGDVPDAPVATILLNVPL